MMGAFEILSLAISTGTLGGVVKLVWMLSQHDARLGHHEKRITNLEARRTA